MLSPIRNSLTECLAVKDKPDFANRLATREPSRDRPRRVTALLLLLVAVCFVPRALMASRIDTVCVDGTLYFHLADGLERGQIDPLDSGHLQTGTYPVVLATLHRWGLEWESGAKLYGVLVSTLAVLPLFGWARRQFDERVATLACLLYAGHPKLIEWSPEAVREPSVWFFFLLSLYLLWRAATEVDWRFFAAGGAATALTSLTRFEGWFLLFPLLGWTSIRFFHLHSGRWRLVGGCACGLAAVPVVFLAFGQMLPSGAGWRHLRSEPLERAGVWLLSWQAVNTESSAPVNPESSPPPAAAQTAAPPPVAAVPPSWTVGQSFRLLLSTFERGLTPLFAILMFGGYFSRLRLFHRSDNLPLLLIVLAVTAGIWIHLWHAHLASSRYVLTIVLVATRSAALGLMEFGQLAARWLSGRWPRAQFATTAGLLLVFVMAGSIDAVSSDFQSRGALASLGTWIRARCGHEPLVVGSESQLMLVGYYAHGTAYAFPHELSGEALAGWIGHVQPDVVVISKRRQQPADYQTILDQRERLGLELIVPDLIPCDTKNMIVLARPNTSRQVLRQATRGAIEPP